ncbi:DUF6879 family protein [Amycolatopsis sp. CA-126428]|uniref:DUF6879 family protein n=1 Tax=Amycolatopsis sp. CA-126428 TaxID=2073158 RepID=UPI0018EADBAE|nr:DUF6879 family protein [Amycolatopsis sp. CA-126428]
MWLEGEAWDESWDNLQFRAWRLEAQPVYTMAEEEEEFARWRRGEEIPPDEEWLDDIRLSVEEGIHFGRVRVIPGPPHSDYLRYQFEVGYKPTIPVGHDVRILDLSRVSNPGLPSEDFWLLDDKVVRMLYREDGTQIGRKLVADPAELRKYEQYMQLAIANSVPFSEYDY